MNYALYHVETYGHGKHEFNELPDAGKVTIQDHDGHFFVYECESDQDAEKIANWFLSAGYESYPEQVSLSKHNDRYYSVETNHDQ